MYRGLFSSFVQNCTIFSYGFGSYMSYAELPELSEVTTHSLFMTHSHPIPNTEERIAPLGANPHKQFDRLLSFT